MSEHGPKLIGSVPQNEEDTVTVECRPEDAILVITGVEGSPGDFDGTKCYVHGREVHVSHLLVMALAKYLTEKDSFAEFVLKTFMDENGLDEFTNASENLKRKFTH